MTKNEYKLIKSAFKKCKNSVRFQINYNCSGVKLSECDKTKLSNWIIKEIEYHESWLDTVKPKGELK